MKLKLSITVDEHLVQQVEEAVQEGRFRNRSHILEYALKQFLREEHGRT